MSRHRYYIRVLPEDIISFEEHFNRNNIDCTFISIDMGNGSSLYTAALSHEEASTVRLSFGFAGFLDINRTLSRQVERRSAKITTINLELL